MTELDPETVEEIETVFVPLHELVTMTAEQEAVYRQMQQADVDTYKEEQLATLQWMTKAQSSHIAKLEQGIARRDATIEQLTTTLQASIETGKGMQDALRSMQAFAERIHAERHALEEWKRQHAEVIGLLEALAMQLTIHMDCDADEAWLRIYNAVMKGIFEKFCDEAEFRSCIHCKDQLCGMEECGVCIGDNNDSYLRGVHIQQVVRAIQREQAEEQDGR